MRELANQPTHPLILGNSRAATKSKPHQIWTEPTLFPIGVWKFVVLNVEIWCVELLCVEIMLNFGVLNFGVWNLF